MWPYKCTTTVLHLGGDKRCPKFSSFVIEKSMMIRCCSFFLVRQMEFHSWATRACLRASRCTFEIMLITWHDAHQFVILSHVLISRVAKEIWDLCKRTCNSLTGFHCIFNVAFASKHYFPLTNMSYIIFYLSWGELLRATWHHVFFSHQINFAGTHEPSKWTRKSGANLSREE